MSDFIYTGCVRSTLDKQSQNQADLNDSCHRPTPEVTHQQGAWLPERPAFSVKSSPAPRSPGPPSPAAGPVGEPSVGPSPEEEEEEDHTGPQVLSLVYLPTI